MQNPAVESVRKIEELLNGYDADLVYIARGATRLFRLWKAIKRDWQHSQRAAVEILLREPPSSDVAYDFCCGAARQLCDHFRFRLSRDALKYILRRPEVIRAFRLQEELAVLRHEAISALADRGSSGHWAGKLLERLTERDRHLRHNVRSACSDAIQRLGHADCPQASPSAPRLLVIDDCTDLGRLRLTWEIIRHSLEPVPACRFAVAYANPHARCLPNYMLSRSRLAEDVPSAVGALYSFARNVHGEWRARITPFSAVMPSRRTLSSVASLQDTLSRINRHAASSDALCWTESQAYWEIVHATTGHTAADLQITEEMSPPSYAPIATRIQHAARRRRLQTFVQQHVDLNDASLVSIGMESVRRLLQRWVRRSECQLMEDIQDYLESRNT